MPPSFASRCDTLLGAFYYLGRPCPCCWRRVWRGASAKMIRFASSRPSHFQFDLFYGVFLSLHIFLDFPYHFNAVNTVISLYILPFLLFPLSISFNCLHYSFFPSPPPVSFPYPFPPLPIYNTHVFLFLFPLFLPLPSHFHPMTPSPQPIQSLREKWPCVRLRDVSVALNALRLSVKNVGAKHEMGTNI